MKTKVKKPNLSKVDQSKLLSFLHKDGGDGWTIWKVSKFTDMGFRKEDLPVRVHKSDTRDPKSTIFGKKGEVIEKLEGVYGLTFLYWLAGAYGVDSSNDMMGRGSQARVVTDRILGKLEGSK